jgi:type I restriction enzyme S subunit
MCGAGNAELVTRSTGSTALGIKAWHLREILILIPPLIDQVEITHIIDSETSKIDRLINKIQSSIEKLQEYRTALISAAVTGKIDVRGE